MKRLIVLLMVAGSLLAGCVVEESGYGYRDGARYDGTRSNRDHDRDDLRHEGQRRFLDLGQRLNEGDNQTDDHGGENSRTRGDEDRPDRRLKDVQCIGFIHVEAIPAS